MLTVALRFVRLVSCPARPLTVLGPTSVTLAITSSAPPPSARMPRLATRTARALAAAHRRRPAALEAVV